MRHIKSIKTLGLFSGLLLASVAFTAQASWPSKAYQAESVDGALQQLYQSNHLIDSKDIHITAPEIAENGSVVPVKVESGIPGAESVSLFVEKNPYPLAATFQVDQSSNSRISTRLKFRESTQLLAVVRAKGKLYVSKKQVKVTIGGCGGTTDTSTPGMSRVSGSNPNKQIAGAVRKVDNTIKAKTSVKGDHTQVKMLISHPMETGLNKKDGKTIPAHFIKSIKGVHNGKVVMDAQWGIAVSKNPFFSFDVKGAKKGDKIVIEWQDNKNLTDRVELVI